MFNSPSLKCSCISAVVSSLFLLPVANAATIDQIINPASTVGWNDGAVWGSIPTAGNSYRSVSGFAPVSPVYTVNGITWSHSGSVRDVNDSTTTRGLSSTFLGDNILLSAETRLLGKGTGGSTQTVNLVFDGGFYHQAPSPPPAGTDPSSTLAGTVSFGSSNIGALGMNAGSNGLFTWTITSSVFGGPGDTLQLIIGNDASRLNFLIFSGDLSGFSGTLYMGVSDAMTAPGSSFSLTSDALNATVQLDYTTPNFLFDLGSDNITVGALSLGSGTGTLVAGNMVYDATMLNDLAGGSFFTGTGTITVVPEPGTLALGAVGLLVTVSLLRHRRRNA